MYKKKKEEKFLRACDFPGCSEKGCFRAPKDRNLNTYYWFCLKHVAEYNKNWDFCQGLSEEEIERHIQNDVTWQRPTWKLGQNQTYHQFTERLNDSFGLFDETELGISGKYNPPRKNTVLAASELTVATRFLDVSFPLDLSAVKKQFKKLAKKYHPDTNLGDTKNEALFKELLEHYRFLMKYLAEHKE